MSSARTTTDDVRTEWARFIDACRTANIVGPLDSVNLTRGNIQLGISFRAEFMPNEGEAQWHDIPGLDLQNIQSVRRFIDILTSARKMLEAVNAIEREHEACMRLHVEMYTVDEAKRRVQEDVARALLIAD